MRVTGSIGASARSPKGIDRMTVAPGFHLAGPGLAAPPPPTNAAGAAAALLGLQDIALPIADRRRCAIGRGLALLDRLDGLRLGLLDGAVPLAALQGLRAELGRSAELDGDPCLSALLGAIDVRCAVEVAKLEAADASGSP